MTNLAVKPIFLDTNILVYANVTNAPLHTVALNRLQQLWDEGPTLWVSRQILREYLAVLTRPQGFSEPQAVNVATERVKFFTNHFHIADDNEVVTENLLTLIRNHDVKGKQIHDANIVATMQAYGITHLLTNNVGDFQRYAHLITIQSL